MVISLHSTFWVALHPCRAVFSCSWIPSFLLVDEGRRKYEIQQCTKGMSSVWQTCSALILKAQSWALFPSLQDTGMASKRIVEGDAIPSLWN